MSAVLPLRIKNSKAKAERCCFPVPHFFLLKASYRCQAMLSQINDRLSASGGFCTNKVSSSCKPVMSFPPRRGAALTPSLHGRAERLQHPIICWQIIEMLLRHLPCFITRPNC